MKAFDATIQSLLPHWPVIAPAQRADVARRCISLVREQIGLAPIYTRWGLSTLFIAYRCFALLRAGWNPSPATRADILSAFSSLPLPMVMGLERVLRSTALLFYFEQPEVLSALGEETIAERQSTFRAERMRRQTYHQDHTLPFVGPLGATGERTG